MSGAPAPALLVIGATGSLGGAVCAAAARALPGVRVVRASRSARGADAVRVDLADAASVHAAARGAAAAICAVGPFDWDPAPAIRACSEAGCHWIDLADRPRFLAAAESAARDARVAVVTGASATPGLVEALATPAATDTAALRAWWSVGSRKAVSGALLYALLRPLGRGGMPGRIRARAIGGVPFWFGRHAWPRGERARLAARDVAIELSVGMDHRAQAAALAAFAPLLGWIPEPILLRAAHAFQPATRAIQRLGSARGALAVERVDAAGRVLGAVEVLADNGIDLAALPPVWAARALLGGGAGSRGAVPFGALLPPDALADAMHEAGWIVTRS